MSSTQPDFVVWDMTVPEGVQRYVHMMSITNVLVEQSNDIYRETGGLSSADTIHCGYRALSLIEMLPHFSIDGSLPSTRHKGQLWRWRVFLDPDLGDWHIKLSYETGQREWSRFVTITGGCHSVGAEGRREVPNED